MEIFVLRALELRKIIVNECRFVWFLSLSLLPLLPLSLLALLSLLLLCGLKASEKANETMFVQIFTILAFQARINARQVIFNKQF